MLLIDFSGTVYAAILKQIYSGNDFLFDEDLTRHSIISSLRKYKKKFFQYGQPIIVCDSKNYWRKSIFPYYKSNRKVAQEADKKVNWNAIFTFIEKIKEELKCNLPWTLIEIMSAEADDIIAHICQRSNEDIMIVSRDHDLVQLQRNPRIKQYNPVDDRYETTDDINKFLFEHICRGDKGDGIPNIASPDNSIAIGQRQKAIQTKKLNQWYEEKKVPEELLKRFTTNMKLIDLRLIPENIRESIDEAMNQSINNKASLQIFLKYLRDNDLSELIALVGDFF